jgi:uncharacterized protein YjdB
MLRKRQGIPEYLRTLGERAAELKSIAVVAAIAIAVTLTGCADAVTAPEQVTAATLAPSLDLIPGVTLVIGDRVKTSGTTNVRQSSSITSKLVGTQPAGAVGTLIGGPKTDSSGDRLLRWQVNFDSGPDGWVAEPYAGLVKISTGIATAAASVEVTPGQAGLNPAATMQLVAVVRDASGAIMTGGVTSWLSSNTAVATVSSSGLLTGVSVGSTAIIASGGGKSDTATVAVVPVGATALFIGDRVKSTGDANIRSGPADSYTMVGTQIAGAVGTIIGGPVLPTTGDRLLRWQVDFDQGVDGWAAEPYVGLTKISTPTLSTVARVDVNPDSVMVVTGGTGQLTAVALDVSGSNVLNQTMTWTSRDTLKAKVSVTGLVTGLAAGTVYVVATTAGKADSAKVLVTLAAPAVASITVSPTTASVLKGSALQLGATAKDASGNVLPAPITWASSNGTVATVSGSGQVSGVAAGTATISATSGGKSGSAAVTVTVASVHKGWYAAPNGSSSGAGTMSSPWSLATALAGAGGKVQPGDTIWLRGGTYTGKQVSTVAGVSGKPVVVRQYPGERATLDANGITGDHFVVKGGWTVFMDFEVANSNTTRYFNSTSNGMRPNNVVNNASNTKYINLKIHDGGVAFYNYRGQTNVEVYGCIIYNNGWMGSDRGHGHALYIQSDYGPVVLKDNVLFNQFGYGVHIYGNAGSGSLNNIRLEGNVAFNNGTLATSGTAANILYGGASTSNGAAVIGNMTYHSPGVSGTNVRVGYSTTQNGSATIQGNYVVGGSLAFDMGYWTSAMVSGNTWVGSSGIIGFNDPSTSGKSFSSNSHLRDPATSSWKYKGSSYSFSAWRSATGLGSTDQAQTAMPTATKVVVRANPHVPGRAVVTVYNWGRQSSTSVSMNGVLSTGDQYVVRNAQIPYGPPIASGSYGGSISLPLTAVTPVAPVGWTSKTAPSTGSDFAVFVVEKL